MDMSLREWLVLIGVIGIAVVFIGGFYRMHLAKKRANELHFGLEEVRGDAAAFSSELPNGGARKTGSSEPALVKERATQKGRRVEPGFSSMSFDNDNDNTGFVESDQQETTLTAGSDDPFKKEEMAGTVAESPLTAVKAAASEKASKRKIKAENNFMPHELDNEPEDLSVEGSLRLNNRTSERKARKITRPEPKGEATEKLSDRPPVKEVVVINVIAKGDQSFDGARLLQSLLNSGMRFGDMSIFHRYSNDNGTGKIQFSMANGVEPGIFSVDNIDGTTTPAVSFFMGLPGPDEPVKAFTLMVETARQLALDLGGELKDEQFSVMTQQTIEHSRQRIIDYERKQLAQRVPG